MQNQNVPPILYKYYSPSSWKNVFKSWTMRFSPPEDLNDPFEAQLAAEGFLSTKELKRYINEIISTSNFISEKHDNTKTRKEKRKALKNYRKELEHKIRHRANCGTIGKDIQNDLSECARKNFGLLCLSENTNNNNEDTSNILMWSHYAYYHKGFMIGIDTNKLIEHIKSLCTNNLSIRFHKIKYTINRKRKLISNYTHSIDVFLEKSDQWEYEKEWRSIIVLDKNYLDFPWKNIFSRGKEIKGIFEISKDCITSVTFGAMMKDSHIKAKCRHIRSQLGCEHIELKRMRLHDTDYSLIRESIPEDFFKNINKKKVNIQPLINPHIMK